MAQDDWENATIFIVDDDAAVRDSLKLLLDAYGLRVRDYESTEAFLRHYRRRDRECLILDQHLPQVTGLDFLTSARASGLAIPVILITGRGDSTTRDRALRAGVVAYLEKPVPRPLLVSAIRGALGSGGLRLGCG